MSSSGPDFSSMLATFQAATGATNNDKVKASTKDEDSTSATSSKKTTKLSSLKDLTDRMWRVKQIKAATQASSIVARESKNEQPIRLAVCCCIVNEFPHENIWKRWMSWASSDAETKDKKNCSVSAELFIHAKEPEKITSEWLKGKLISKTYRPNWNDVRIVRAMLQLIEEALRPAPPDNEDNNTQGTQQAAVTHILFATESCIPICTLDDVSSYLQHGTSYMKYYGREKATRFDEQSVWNILEKYVPSQAIHKALPGWCVVSAKHAQAILNMPSQHLEGQDLWPAFDKVWAPEEVFFPTALSLLGLLDNKETTQNKALTYSEWDHRARNYQDRAHPKFWDDEFGEGFVQYLRHEHQCLFLRKVKYGMPLERWERAIQTTTSNTKLSHQHEYDSTQAQSGKRKHSYSNRRHEDDKHYKYRRESDSYRRSEYSSNNEQYSRRRGTNDYYRRQNYDDPPSNRRRRY